jgi:hypothetical protein
MVNNHGLKLPQPIMCNTRESGDCLYMFQSGNKYYIWNPIEGAVWEILTSMDLVGIVTEISKLDSDRWRMRGYMRCRLPADFRLENDWAALDSPLCYTIQLGIMARLTQTHPTSRSSGGNTLGLEQGEP